MRISDWSSDVCSSDLSSFTATGFYKKFYDYIQAGQFNLEVTNNGVTEDVRVNRPVNGDGASIYGAEFAFQTFFDFLPAPFEGFGVQANYTYVKNDGIETVNFTNETAGGTAGGGLTSAECTEKAKAHAGLATTRNNHVG